MLVCVCLMSWSSSGLGGQRRPGDKCSVHPVFHVFFVLFCGNITYTWIYAAYADAYTTYSHPLFSSLLFHSHSLGVHLFGSAFLFSLLGCTFILFLSFAHTRTHTFAFVAVLVVCGIRLDSHSHTHSLTYSFTVRRKCVVCVKCTVY